MAATADAMLDDDIDIDAGGHEVFVAVGMQFDPVAVGDGVLASPSLVS